MTRRAQMLAVELVEHDELEDAPSTPPPARWRPPWRWVAVPVALVLALAGAQAVTDARERARLAELAAVPGVVRPVDRDLRVLWTPQDGTDSVLWSGIEAAGAMVGLAHAPDGSQAVVAVDRLTGDQRWTTPVAPAPAVAPADGGGSGVGGCVPLPEVSRRVLCLVSDTYLEYGELSVRTVVGTLSRLVVVDTGDGAVLGDHPAPGAVAFTALPGLAVVGVPVGDGGLVVTASDLVTGEQAWRTSLPAPPRDADDDLYVDGRISLFGTAEGMGVVQSPGRMTLLDPGGVVVRSGIDARSGFEVDAATRTVAALSFAPDGLQRTTFLSRGPDVMLTGNRVTLSADDGSVPGLVLMSDTTVRAYDRGRSTPRWSISHAVAGNALVLRGRVYLSTDVGLVAVDARTGEELWRASTPAGRTMGALVTDGRHLLSAQERPDGAGEVTQDDWPGVGELVAYRFADGGEDWRVDLPGDLLGVWSTGSTLVGWGPAGSSVLG
ncbi:PQQ-binding-like beta-propeller repeat protein [Cellulomonas humilata]|uniref:PQQ-binding-like beta-propeller repeat protein n=1 Tax=Cellulomonas humilata TaxID=144055 RepID=A0A7Y6A216_9CELL|nr:PQQ-binding-like beta-propeller repeat protein [Cellulomonas humilata]NUU18311.1 PQQ-binding-like beta-propeller repeat protein [Cellulomonas humilata]